MKLGLRYPLLILWFGMAASVNASVINFDYASPDPGGPNHFTGMITIEDTLNSVGGYNVASLVGNVDGDVIEMLTPNPNQPGGSRSTDSLFTFDNVVFSEAPFVDFNGLLFTSAGFEYNLFSDTANIYELLQAQDGVLVANSTGSLQVSVVSQVPEPHSWALLLTGFGLTGSVVRRRNSREGRLLASQR